MNFLPYIVHLPLIFAIAFQIKKKYHTEPLNSFYWIGISLKLVAGVTIGILYLYYFNYQGDTFLFQKKSCLLTEYFYSDPQNFFSILFFDNYDDKFKSLISVWNEPRTMFMIKGLSILNLFTFGNYWINSLYFSLFSFLGIWFLGNILVKHYKIALAPVVFSFLLFPSFLFWSSGLIKDSLLVGAICFILYLLIKIRSAKKTKVQNYFTLLLLLYLTWKIKFYYIAILGSVILSYLITDYLFKKIPTLKSNLKFLIFPCVLAAIIISAILLIPTFHISHLLFIMHYSYKMILIDAGNYSFDNLKPEVTSYITHFPEAVFTGLFRPLPWESSKLLPILISLENVVIIILLAGLVFAYFKRKKKSISLSGYSLLIYVILSAALMAFIAPNWGTLSRYKAGYLMFWVLLLSHNNPVFTYAVNQLKALKVLFSNYQERKES